MAEVRDDPGTPVCSVVVPTFNAAATLAETLAALAAQTCVEQFEVVIADNGSTDGSAEVALGWRGSLPLLRIVDATRARGVSAARNDGIAAAATDLILICDADDVVCPGWVRAMLTGLADADFVGGPLETHQLNDLTATDWMPLPELSPELPETYGGRRYAFGGNLGMRRTVWTAAGGFDETYAAGAEEIDFAWRAYDAGFAPQFVPDAVVHYRLRTDLRSLVRQQYFSGLGTAQVFATFQPPGVPTRTWHRRIRHEVRLLARFPSRGTRADRGAWLALIAFEAGKAWGAVKFRRAVP